MYAFGDGFDLYAAVGDYAAYWDTMGIATSMILGTPGRFTGSRCLRNSGGSQTLLTKNGANDPIHHLNFAYSNTDNQNTTPTATAIGFTLFDGSTAQCTVNFREDGTLELRSGAIGGTVLASWTGAYFAQAVWHTYEVEVVVHNTAGSITVRRNGRTSADFTATGLNTRGGTANNYANRMSIVTGTISGTSGCYIDDILWRSDPSSVPWIGDVRCYTRMPASDASVQFSKAPSSIASNTLCVNEAQQDLTNTYDYDSTVGQSDLYNIAASTTPAGTVTAVTTRGFLMKGDAPGALGGAMQVKSGGTTTTSPLEMLSTNFVYYYRTDLTDPNTGSAWTAANVNSVQIGPLVTETMDILTLIPPLDPRITFARASVGTYFDASGTLLTAPTGAPRFDWDPIAHTTKGLLIEEARTNYWLQSGDISQGSNNPTPNDVIKQANVALAPDGTLTASKIIPTTTTGQHTLYRSYSAAFSVPHVTSFYLKAAGYNQVMVSLGNTGFPANGNCTFDLNTGTVISQGSGANASGIIPVGNGWYRCWVSVTALASGTLVANFTPYSGTVSFAGDGVSGVYAWGGQVEVGAFPTSLVPTLAASVARSADTATMPWLGPTMTGFSFAVETMSPVAYGGANNWGYAEFVDSTGTANRMGFYEHPQVAVIAKNGATQWNFNIGATPTTGAVTKAAIASSAAGTNATINGAVPTNNAVTLGAPISNINIGNVSGARNGHIRRLRAWNRALSNAELQSVTT